MKRHPLSRRLSPLSAALVVFGTTAFYVVMYLAATGLGTGAGMHSGGGYYEICLDWDTLCRLCLSLGIVVATAFWLRERCQPAVQMGWYGPRDRRGRYLSYR